MEQISKVSLITSHECSTKSNRFVIAIVSILFTMCPIAPSQAQLHLLSPNGDEVFMEGLKVPISWTGVSRFTVVSIEYQEHPNSPWVMIEPFATGLHFDWQPPVGVISQQLKIRLTTELAQRSDSTMVRIIGGGHGTAVYKAIYSHDGGRLFSICDRGMVKEWNGWTGELLREFPLLYNANALEISANDRFLAYAGDSSVVYVDLLTSDVEFVHVNGQVQSLRFDQASQRIAVTLVQSLHVYVISMAEKKITEDLVHPNIVHEAEFNTDGSLILSACADRSARIWNVESETALWDLSGHTLDNTSAHFNSDGSLAVTTGIDNLVRIWNVNTGELLPVVEYPSIVRYAEFSPNGREIVAICEDKRGYIWNSLTQTIRLHLQPHLYDVSTVKYSPDGKYILTINGTRELKVWESVNGAIVFQPEEHTNDLTFASFSADGRLVTTCLDGGVRTYDLMTEKLAFSCMGHSRLYAGHQGRVYRATFDELGKRVISANEDGTICWWNAETGTFLNRSQSRPYAFQYVDVHSTSGRVVGTNTFGAYIYSTDGELLGSFSTDATRRELWKSVFSPQGDVIVVIPGETFQDTTFDVIDGYDGAPKFHIEHYDEKVVDAEFSPDNYWLATISNNGQIRIYDAHTGDQVHHFTTENVTLSHLAFSPDGERLAFHGAGQQIWLIDTQAWVMLDPLMAIGGVLAFDWSSDSKLIAAISIDRVDVIDVQGAATVKRMDIISHAVNKSDVQFSPDGQFLASMCDNVDVFETTTWRKVHHLEGRNEMRHIQWAEDNNRILVISFHHQPWVWDLTPIVDQYDESDGVWTIMRDETSVSEDGRGQVLLYPNPVGASLTIRAPQQLTNSSFEIVNTFGEVVARGQLTHETTEIPFSPFASGAYAVRIGRTTTLLIKR